MVQVGPSLVRIPAGPPLIELTGKLSDDSIRRWGLYNRFQVMQTQKCFLLNEALIYWLRMYVIDEDLYPKAMLRAEAVINQLPDKPSED